MYTPLEQFEILRWIPLHVGFVDISVTNSTVALAIGITLLSLFQSVVRQTLLVPTEWQSVFELKSEFVKTIVRDQIGESGSVYYPILYTLFGFISTNNLIGMIPYSFTPTSHLAVTLAMSFTIFFAVTSLGFMVHGLGYFRILLPEGVSVGLIPLIVAIETISYCMRAISLGVRLAANMLAGHALLHIISGFTWQFMTHKSVMIKVLSIIPLTILIALTGSELVIAFLQSYVSTVLTCSYINDAINLH